MRSPTFEAVAFACALTLITLSMSAHSALLSEDDPFFGPGSITQDTATRLQWLDVPLSKGLTVSEVLSEINPAGAFRGMRYATAAELTRLFQDAGIPVIGPVSGQQNLNYPIAQSLINLVGATAAQGVFPETVGFFDATPRGPTADIDFFFQGQSPAYLVGVGDAFRNPDLHWSTIGHWLVREVPEPRAWLLVAVGAFMCARTVARLRRTG